MVIYHQQFTCKNEHRLLEELIAIFLSMSVEPLTLHLEALTSLNTKRLNLADSVNA